ncbi:MAG: ABC transporter substrate-binding protein, partial [Flavobacteriaceae bacterium]|nr:ABC transporter substrate-binding protein [Flavobacteriaceae bacterium]
YAACGDGNGIKVAQIDNPNLVDSQQWQNISTGNFQFIQAVDNRLYTINNNKNLFEIINNSLQQRRNFSANPQDMRVVDDLLIVTTDLRTLVFDSELTRILAIEIPVELTTNYNASTVTDTHIYIGTTSLGLIEFERKEPVNYNIIRPEGPLRNEAFKLEAKNNELWVSFGDYSVSYNPFPIRRYGLSHLVEENWINIPNDSLLGAANLNYISISPFVANEVFVSSFQEGLLKVNDNEATILYDENNSGLESLTIPGDPDVRSIRISGTKFDSNGTLWVLNSRVDEALKSFDPMTGQWRGYSFNEIIENPLIDELGFQEVVIDDNGTKWVASFDSGVIGFNENVSNGLRNINTQEQGFESPIVKALAVDNRNQLWIGTIRGLRVLYNTANFFEAANPIAREIVFVDDGIPKELLAGQFITDIKVDASNNKWVGTLDSGVFYFSSDGQQTIYHFTKDNSPLPSNIINDISLDFSSGRVYMATSRGLVSFLAGGSEPSDELSEAYVYPNPVRPEYNILGFDNLNDINQGVKVKGLTENVNIKITDIEGNLVAEAQSGVNIRSGSNYNFAIDGGTAVWNGRNLANNIVASGVYLFMISDLDTFETKVLKLLVIR